MAKGTHRWPSDAELRAKVGPAAAGCQVLVHDPDDEAALALVGTTSRGTPVWINKAVAEADLFLAIGAVVTHYMAGYGGGPKIVLPGVSGRKTIVANHCLAASPDALQAQTTGNPMYEDMLEAAEIARLAMKIDAVLDMDNRLVGVVAGEVGPGHQAGDRRLQRHLRLSGRGAGRRDHHLRLPVGDGAAAVLQGGPLRRPGDQGWRRHRAALGLRQRHRPRLRRGHGKEAAHPRGMGLGAHGPDHADRRARSSPACWACCGASASWW